MRAYDLIYKKRNGGKLTQEEIDFFVRSFINGEITDYQASAFLMTVFFRGMDGQETAHLTQSMTDSGIKLDLSSVQGIKVDKHSTGGVGDGISLVLGPLAAACGVPVPMISGRGLAHTGGTLDKLESIPGFRVNLAQEEFIEQLKKIGIAMIGQTKDIAPADKKIYALRDVTATVDSIPLISASIMSKKLAEGCGALVLDVKTGSGAFMPKKEDAVRLAKVMVDIGKRCKKKMVALITDMDQPLGKAIGNGLEIKQTVEILQGKEEPGTKSFIELTEILGGWMLFFAGLCKDSKTGKGMISKARLDGSGLKKFKTMIEMQGGNAKVCDDPDSILPKAKHVKAILSPWKGTVTSMNARSVGISAMILGAGREKQESKIDHSAGIILHKKVGNGVERHELLADFYYSDETKLDEAEKIFLAGLKIGKMRPKSVSLIHQVIR